MSPDEVREAVTETILTELRVLHVALMLGVLLFLGVVLALHLLSVRQDAADAAIPDALSVVHAALFLAATAVGLALTRRRPAPAPDAAGRAANALAVVRRAHIAGLVLLEGAALFGLVVCLLAVLQGAMQDQPLYWLNLLSTGVFLAVTAATIPTRDRVETTLRRTMRAG